MNIKGLQHEVCRNPFYCARIIDLKRKCKNIRRQKALITFKLEKTRSSLIYSANV